MSQMEKLLSYLVTWLLVIGVLSFLPPTIYATEICTGANLECQYDSDCISPHTCKYNSYYGLKLCTKTYVTPYPKTRFISIIRAP
jgi:hypothetical protein